MANGDRKERKKSRKLNTIIYMGNSLVVQWLGLRTFTTEGTGSIPGWGNKIPQAVWCSKKKFFLLLRSVSRSHRKTPFHSEMAMTSYWHQKDA